MWITSSRDLTKSPGWRISRRLLKQQWMSNEWARDLQIAGITTWLTWMNKKHREEEVKGKVWGKPHRVLEGRVRGMDIILSIWEASRRSELDSDMIWSLLFLYSYFRVQVNMCRLVSWVNCVWLIFQKMFS